MNMQLNMCPSIDTKHTRNNDNLSVFKNSQEEKIFKSTLLELTRIARIYCGTIYYHRQKNT